MRECSSEGQRCLVKTYGEEGGEAGGECDGEEVICSSAALLLARPWKWAGFDKRFGGGSTVVQVTAGCRIFIFFSYPLAF